MSVVPTELQEPLELLLRQEHHKIYHTEIETSPQVKPQNKLSRLYPFLHGSFLCVGGRLAQADLTKISTQN